MMEPSTLLFCENLQSSQGSLLLPQQAQDNGDNSELHTSRYMASDPDCSLVETQKPHHIHQIGQCPSLAADTYLDGR